LTQPPPLTHEIEVELSDEELAAVTAKARTVGFDLQTYLRVRMLTPGTLPEPCAFFALNHRLSRFARDYKACLAALAQRRPDARQRADLLGTAFARILKDWTNSTVHDPECAETCAASAHHPRRNRIEKNGCPLPPLFSVGDPCPASRAR
jgi:hypothetical protein